VKKERGKRLTKLNTDIAKINISNGKLPSGGFGQGDKEKKGEKGGIIHHLSIGLDRITNPV
jgi:hypothetical protein